MENKKVIEYLGKKYIPIRKTNKDFFELTKTIDVRYELTPKGYDIKEFYKIAKQLGYGKVDVFLDEDANYIIPADAKFFLWKGEKISNV